MRKKGIVAAALLSVLALTGMPAMAQDSGLVHLIIQNTLYQPTGQQAVPQLIGDRVYVPLRAVGEGLDYSVDWQAHSRQVYISTQEGQAVPMGEPVAEDAPITILIDGTPLETDAFTGQPFITEAGYTMVPMRVVGEALHCDVQWLDGIVLVNRPVVEEQTSKPEEEVITNPNYQLTIMGPSIATAQQLNAYLDRKESDIRTMMERNYPELGFTPFPEHIAELYLSIGAKYNIRGDLAFAQALKETGYFQFYGSVLPFQNNFCGLGASGIENTGEEALNGVAPDRAFYIPGLHGLTFMTVADGVEAHIQHLYAYATDEPLPAGCELVDPRFQYVKRGVAERWTDLNGRWAVPGDGYGESIIDQYWQPACQ